MAKKKHTSNTSVQPDKIQLEAYSIKLHRFAALLAGVGQIMRAEEGSDALFVAAKVCQRINGKLCEIADVLNSMSKEGGAA